MIVKFDSLLYRTDGQGLVEYALILLLIVAVVWLVVYGPGLFVHRSISSVTTEFPR